MSRVNYTARRSIATGHTLNNAYTLEILPREINETRDTVNKKSVSIAGTTQNVISRREQFYDVETERFLLGTQEYEDILEFLESVDMFEPFNFDAYGTAANPGSYQVAILESNYKKNRVEQTNEFTFSFKLKVF